MVLLWLLSNVQRMILRLEQKLTINELAEP